MTKFSSKILEFPVPNITPGNYIYVANSRRKKKLNKNREDVQYSVPHLFLYWADQQADKRNQHQLALANLIGNNQLTCNVETVFN